MVNPDNPYGIMDIRSEKDTLSVWVDRLPDLRTRFLVDTKRGRVVALSRVPRRRRPAADSISHFECPEKIYGSPSPTASRVSIGGVPPVVTAIITKLDVGCTKGRYPAVGSEKDGEIEFTITVRAWIDYEIKDREALERGQGTYGADVLFEALSASSEVLGSSTMRFEPYIGARSGSLNTCIEGVTEEEVPRVARVVASWR
jgi:hypothetical protein